MRTFLLLLSFLSFGCSYSVSAQTVFYSYDPGGNRITRGTVRLYSAKQSGSEQEEKITNSLLTCQVTVYPNPTAGELNIAISNGEEDALSRIWLYDDSGKLLKTLEVTGNTSTTIDLSGYSEGMYLIDFSQGDSKSYYKVIKQ